MNVRGCDLPGIGHKFEIVTRSNDKLVIVIHDDGRREVYHYGEDDFEESISSVTFNDQEARQVAAMLGGMVYKPQAVENIEMVIEGLVIDWYKVESGAKAIGQSIINLDIRKNYNVTIVSILKKDKKKLFSPDPETIIEKGDMLVISGEKQDLKKMINELLIT